MLSSKRLDRADDIDSAYLVEALPFFVGSLPFVWPLTPLETAMIVKNIESLYLLGNALCSNLLMLSPLNGLCR
jgi:hypothetical protein